MMRSHLAMQLAWYLWPQPGSSFNFSFNLISSWQMTQLAASLKEASMLWSHGTMGIAVIRRARGARRHAPLFDVAGWARGFDAGMHTAWEVRAARVGPT